MFDLKKWISFSPILFLFVSSIVIISYFTEHLWVFSVFFFYLVGKILRLHSLEIQDFGGPLFSRYSGLEQVMFLQNIWLSLFLILSCTLVFLFWVIFKRSISFSRIFNSIKEKDLIFFLFFLFFLVLLIIEILFSTSYSYSSVFGMTQNIPLQEVQKNLLYALKVRSYISISYKIFFFILTLNTPGNLFFKSISLYSIFFLMRSLDNISCLLFDTSFVLAFACLPCVPILIETIKNSTFLSWLFYIDCGGEDKIPKAKKSWLF